MPGSTGASKEIPLILDKIVFKEIKIQGFLSQDVTSVQPAIKLANRESIPWGKMITHRFSSPRGGKQSALVEAEMPEEEAIKVVHYSRLIDHFDPPAFLGAPLDGFT